MHSKPGSAAAAHRQASGVRARRPSRAAGLTGHDARTPAPRTAAGPERRPRPMSLPPGSSSARHGVAHSACSAAARGPAGLGFVWSGVAGALLAAAAGRMLNTGTLARCCARDRLARSPPPYVALQTHDMQVLLVLEQALANWLRMHHCGIWSQLLTLSTLPSSASVSDAQWPGHR